MEKELLLHLPPHSNYSKSELFQQSHFAETPGTDPFWTDVICWLDREPLEFLWPRDWEHSTSEENKHRWTTKLSLIIELKLIT